jgi:ParB family transcriptional regulator, chromosome partitioning protein
MSTTATNGTNGTKVPTRHGFDFKRTDHYLCDPFADLCIVGGNVLPEQERGMLDTDEDPSNVLHDGARLRQPLEEPFVLNINALGILETIVIAKVGDVACVVEGRTRVRAARVVNARRAARGEPPIKVPCQIRRTNDADLLSVMVAGNEARRDEDIRGKIEKLKRLMARGVDVHGCAVIFKTTASVVESWLRFDDLAIDGVKAAVDAGRLALSAGIELARLGSPELQRRALEEVEKTPGRVSVSKARKVAKMTEKPTAHVGVKERGVHKRLLRLVQNKSHAKGTTREALQWWAGVEAALELIVGSDDRPDERLLALLGEATTTTEAP